MLKKVLIAFLLYGSFSALSAQDKKKEWVDSIFQTLNTREKIGQLFMLSASAYAEQSALADLMDDVKEYHPGSILLTQGGPVSTAALINQLQHHSAVPLLIGINAEWGLSTTLDSILVFPKPLLIGALKDDSLTYQLASEIARQMKLIGIHVNFAPNTDTRVRSNDPSSYISDDNTKVAKKALAFMKGMQDHGILTCAKYTPQLVAEMGAKGKPAVDLNLLDTANRYVSEKLISAGIGGMLTSPLQVVESKNKKSSSDLISRFYISEVLKKKMGFGGLTFTYIPYLYSLSGKSKGETEKLGFEMGVDILIDPLQPKEALQKIASVIKRNAELASQLDATVRKILAAKYDAGLSTLLAPPSSQLPEEVNAPHTTILNQKLIEAAITVAKNDNNLLPIRTLDNQSFASLSIGTGDTREFETFLSRYASFENYTLYKASDTLQLGNNFSEKKIYIIGLYQIDSKEKEGLQKWILRLAQTKTIILCSFENPYDLIGFDEIPTIIAAYTNQSPAPAVVAQLIFGARQGKGILPVTLTSSLKENQGYPNTTLNRFGFDIPESVGMDSETLKKIRAVVQEAIDSAATPGCNVVVARKGQVIYNEAFGWKTYDGEYPIQKNTIYDLASITKVTATLQTVMFMYEKGMIDINKKASTYLPELKTSNKKDFTIKDIITHQAGLWPYLPFWIQTMEDSTLLPAYYDSIQSEEYPFPVADHVFAVKTMKDSLWHWIVNAKIREKTPRTPYNYTYSDMGFYIMQHLAEKLLNQPLQDFVAQNFYDPIGAYTTGFLPLERFPPSRIAPTEVDKLFRGSKLVGYVHDQGAAMHGGVAGHAGLFSDALDLAKMGQMWLQGGNYGGQQYFKPETLKLFTTKQYEPSRRGLGWDKPTVSEWNGPTSVYASPLTFGHTGFTGTSIWVDPQFDLVFVFLSNRVYPDMLNTKLLTRNIRTRVQDIVYESIFNYCKYEN